MQDLTLVGLTEDKSKLVLVSDSGEEYALPADARLRAALRGDHARLGQLEIQMDSALRPRDIQARIRAGETPENVAQAAQTTVDRIMAYAAPVLAERAHIAQRAQRASLRRKGVEGPARLLEDAVAETLRDRNLPADSVEWDSWRREDGRWTLVADLREGDRARRAEFLFDAPGRYVLAENDEARRLVGEQPSRRSGQGGDSQPSGRGDKQRRLSAVQEDELPLGADAIELVTGGSEARPDLGPEELPLGDGGSDLSPHERTVDLTQTAREVRRREDAPGAGAGAGAGAAAGEATGDADWIATQASERPAATPPAAADEEQAGPSTGSAAEDPAGSAPAADADADGAESAEPTTRKGRKGRRASVPSWDEIMFGGGRSD